MFMAMGAVSLPVSRSGFQMVNEMCGQCIDGMENVTLW